jgi:4-aminobutyrate aminotransferase / (S)-3-amino-2-methylpropionate transaminase / 5-aminovalerate transaminase
VLDVFESEGLVERSGQIGEVVRGRMLSWQERWPVIGDVRGLGAMLAIEFVSGSAAKTPAPELARAVIDEALTRGLLLISCGIHSNCIRELAPLVITDAELDEALGVWEEALAAALD